MIHLDTGSGSGSWGACEASWAVVGIKQIHGYPGLDVFLARESRCSVSKNASHGAPTVPRNSNSRSWSPPGTQAPRLDGCERAVCERAVCLSHFAECPRILDAHDTCCSYAYWQMKTRDPEGPRGMCGR